MVSDPSLDPLLLECRSESQARRHRNRALGYVISTFYGYCLTSDYISSAWQTTRCEPLTNFMRVPKACSEFRLFLPCLGNHPTCHHSSPSMPAFPTARSTGGATSLVSIRPGRVFGIRYRRLRYPLVWPRFSDESPPQDPMYVREPTGVYKGMHTEPLLTRIFLSGELTAFGECRSTRHHGCYTLKTVQNTERFMCGLQHVTLQSSSRCEDIVLPILRLESLTLMLPQAGQRSSRVPFRV